MGEGDVLYLTRCVVCHERHLFRCPEMMKFDRLMAAKKRELADDDNPVPELGNRRVGIDEYLELRSERDALKAELVKVRGGRPDPSFGNPRTP